MCRSTTTWLVTIMAILNLTACAEMTTKNYGNRKSGTVKYSEGWMMAEKNRSKALELADEFCNPSRAKVVSENNRSEFTGRTTSTQQQTGSFITGESNQTREKNVYLHFVCGRASAKR